MAQDSKDVHPCIKQLGEEHFPGTDDTSLYMKGYITTRADMYYNARYSDITEHSSLVEQLLAETAFWWSMHHTVANMYFGKPLPELPNTTNKLS